MTPLTAILTILFFFFVLTPYQNQSNVVTGQTEEFVVCYLCNGNSNGNITKPLASVFSIVAQRNFTCSVLFDGGLNGTIFTKDECAIQSFDPEFNTTCGCVYPLINAPTKAPIVPTTISTLPTIAPVPVPVVPVIPTVGPTKAPTNAPVVAVVPTNAPIVAVVPTNAPIVAVVPTKAPVVAVVPTNAPVVAVVPTNAPVLVVTIAPTIVPATRSPTKGPTTAPVPVVDITTPAPVIDIPPSVRAPGSSSVRSPQVNDSRPITSTTTSNTDNDNDTMPLREPNEKSRKQSKDQHNNDKNQNNDKEGRTNHGESDVAVVVQHQQQQQQHITTGSTTTATNTLKADDVSPLSLAFDYSQLYEREYDLVEDSSNKK